MMKCTTSLSLVGILSFCETTYIRHTNVNGKWKYITYCSTCWKDKWRYLCLYLLGLVKWKFACSTVFLCCTVNSTLCSLSDPLTLSLFLSTLKRIYFRVTSTFLSLLFPLLSLTWSQGTPIVTQYNWIPFSFHFL